MAAASKRQAGAGLRDHSWRLWWAQDMFHIGAWGR